MAELAKEGSALQFGAVIDGTLASELCHDHAHATH
jgi:hypothetical protein